MKILEQTNVRILVFTALLAGAGTLPARADALLTNGDLESWGTVSGTPPEGTPTGWQGAGTVIQAPGLVAGSTYSGVIQAGQSGLFYSPMLESTADFDVSFIVAATDPGSGGGRSFNFQLNQAAGTIIGLRMVEGSSGAGFLTLQAFNSTTSAWTNVVQNLNASVYVGGSTNSFTTLNPYTFTFDVNLTATPSYSIIYGAVGGSLTTLSNVNIFSATPTVGGALTSVGFPGGNSATDFGVDNISAVTAVPEPAVAMQAIAGGIFLLAAVRLRKAVSAR